MPWELTTFIFRGYNTCAVFVGSFNPHFSWVLESKGRWSYVKKQYFKRNSNTSKVFMPQASPPKFKKKTSSSKLNNFVQLAKVPPHRSLELVLFHSVFLYPQKMEDFLTSIPKPSPTNKKNPIAVAALTSNKMGHLYKWSCTLLKPL